MNSVGTFDSVIYEIPETKCWKVLTKDCSDNRLFTLMTKDNEANKKDIKFVMDTHIFEVHHVGDKVMLKVSDYSASPTILLLLSTLLY